MKTGKNTKVLALALSAAMLFSSLSCPTASAKVKVPKLSKKKVTVVVGNKKKVTVKYAKKVIWKIKSGKKKIALSKTSKKGATITGKAAGQAKINVTMKYGKKSSMRITHTLKVTVSPKTADTSAKPDKSNSPGVSAPASPAASEPAASAPAASEPAATDPAASDPAPSSAANPTPTPYQGHVTWATTWGTAEEKCNTGDNSAMPKKNLEGTTVRQVIRVTTQGQKIRFRLSNQYGESDVTIKSMHLAKQIKARKPDINVDTDTVVTVNGQEEFTIPKGKVIVTDEINFYVDALENIAISCYFGSAPKTNVTGHRGARAYTYQIEGNHVSDETFTKPDKTTSWFFLADASVQLPEGAKAVVCFGDSITDGYGTDATYLGNAPDSYIRWGDYFAKRLQENEKTKLISVVNEGIGANSILGSYPTDAGKDRFNRDLLTHDNVAYCIILFGINDLLKLADSDKTTKYNALITEYQKMVKLCHDNNIKVYGAPILPFRGYSDFTEAGEEVRKQINSWMRSEDSQFDAIIDFEKAVADPAKPDCVLADYTADFLHPHKGYQAMAEAIDLSLFEN